MKLNKLYLRNIRNHEETSLELDPSINIFYGLNGAGKTSILEAVSICGFSKTFLPTSDSLLINKAKDFYSVVGNCTNELQLPYFVEVNYKKNGEKKINSSYGENLYPKDIIGEIPIVVLSPDFKDITFGSPIDRRGFIDRILSQIYKSYLENLLKYKKVLKHRNMMLSANLKEQNLDTIMLDVYTDALIDLSASISFKRLEFIQEFAPLFINTFNTLTQSAEEAGMIYQPNGFTLDNTSSIDDIKTSLKSEADRLNQSEIRRGMTLFGNHKDEFRITVNGGTAKDYASQGQHKSLLISLKFAEFHILSNIKQETPIILLDDIFSELDNKRIRQVLELVHHNNAQTFITINNADFLKQIVNEQFGSSIFKVENGIALKERS